MIKKTDIDFASKQGILAGNWERDFALNLENLSMEFKMASTVRLTCKEKGALEESFEKILSPLGQFKVFLFGSRTDSKKKGGDIDLFISGISSGVSSKMAITRQLKIDICERIGEQKIDIIWEDNEREGESFREIIASNRVLVWKTKN